MNVDLRRFSVPEQPVAGVDPWLAVEHIIELNTIATFLSDASSGALPSGASAGPVFLDCTWYRQAMDRAVLESPPSIGEHDNSDRPIERLFITLGTNTYTQNLALLEQKLNGMKHRVSTLKWLSTFVLH